MRYFNLVFLFIAFSLTTVKAQEISLEDVVIKTMEHNFNIKIASNAIETSKNNNSRGNAGFLPTVDLTASRSFSNEDTELEFLSGATSSQDAAKSNNLGVSIATRWVVFDGMEMFARMKRFELEELLAESEKKELLLTTLTSVARLYQNLVRSQEFITFLNESVEISTERLTLEKNRLDIGVSSELEVYQAQIDLNEDISVLSQQRIVHQQLVKELSSIVGDEISDDAVFKTLDITLPNYNVDDIVAKVINHSPEILKAKLEYDISSQRIRESRKDYLPEVSLNLSYRLSRMEADASNVTYLQSTGLTWGISAQWNLFNGFNDKREIENAKIETKNRQLRLDQIKYDLTQLAKAISHAYLESKRIYELERANYALADKTLEISRERYNQGLISNFEFREAQQNWLNAQLRFISVKSDLFTEYYRLTYLMGDLIISTE